MRPIERDCHVLFSQVLTSPITCSSSPVMLVSYPNTSSPDPPAVHSIDYSIYSEGL